MLTASKFIDQWNEQRKPAEGALINKRAKKFGNLCVELSKSGADNYTVRINYIKSQKPKKGELKKFMDWITTQADTHEFSLSMAVQSVGRYNEELPDKTKLKEFAEKYGFKNKFEYPNELGYEMVRPHYPEEWEWK